MRPLRVREVVTLAEVAQLITGGVSDQITHGLFLADFRFPVKGALFGYTVIKPCCKSESPGECLKLYIPGYSLRLTN